MFDTLKRAFQVKEIRKKIFITLFLLLVYRIGCWLPLPGVDVSMYTAYMDSKLSEGMDIMGLLSQISGGALRNGSFLALGISPYINASIIMQLLTVAIKPLEELSKQGEEGKRKLNQITRIATLILAAAQSIGIVASWYNEYLMPGIFGATDLRWLISIFVIIILIGGSSFTMWLGEKITELAIGNGISLLIFTGILATAGQNILLVFTTFSTSDFKPIWVLIIFLSLVVVIFAIIVFFDLSERRVPIQYAKQVKGRKLYGGQSTHIPIKVNASGVLPIIFATALITFPQLVVQIFAPTSSFLAWYAKWLGTGTPIYIVLTALLILGFAFFYAQIQFNPEEVSRNIQQYGGFIPGIRPGRPTAEYLGRINKRLTLFGAIFLALIALVPSLVFELVPFFKGSGLTNAFSSTGMLIVVSVALEFDKQLQGQLMMKHYKGFLK